MKQRCRNLIFILGDQLSHSISCLEGADPDQDMILMCEVQEETTYVRHHCKKIILILSAMRHSPEDLRGKGLDVATPSWMIGEYGELHRRAEARR